MNKIILNIRTFYIIFSRIRLPMYNLKIKKNNTVVFIAVVRGEGGIDLRFSKIYFVILSKWDQRPQSSVAVTVSLSRPCASAMTAADCSSVVAYASWTDAADTGDKLCVRLCRRRSQFLRNTLLHVGQLYGLMSVCVNRCVFRLDRWLKLRLHTGHLCGDSSRWRILCTANVRDWQNPLPHSRHLNGFSLEWMYLRTLKTRSVRYYNTW